MGYDISSITSIREGKRKGTLKSSPSNLLLNRLFLPSTPTPAQTTSPLVSPILASPRNTPGNSNFKQSSTSYDVARCSPLAFAEEALREESVDGATSPSLTSICPH